MTPTTIGFVFANNRLKKMFAISSGKEDLTS